MFLLGLREDRKISLYERAFNRCMGLYAYADSIYLSSLYQLGQFQNALAPGQKRDGFDRLYVPQVSYITGDIDIHDIAIDKHGRIIFINILFCCLATVSHTHSFAPVMPFRPGDRLGQGCGIARFKVKSRFTVRDDVFHRAELCRDDRQSGGECIDECERKTLIPDRGEDEKTGAPYFLVNRLGVEQAELGDAMLFRCGYQML